MNLSPIPYNLLYGASLVVFILTLVVGAVQLADPTTLGFDVIATRWIGVIASVLGGIQAILPRINKTPNSQREGMD